MHKMPHALALPLPPHGKLNRRRRRQVQHAFLENFAQFGIMAHACREVGIGSRQTVYQWLESDPVFAAAYAEAEAKALAVLEREAHRRAVEGSPYTRTSYWHGEPVGTDYKVEYSDALLTTLLRARAPEKYREQSAVTVAQIVKVVGVEPSDVL